MSQGWQWGRWVQLCLAIGGPDFCKLCQWYSRFWYRNVLGKSTTFIGFTPKDD